MCAPAEPSSVVSEWLTVLPSKPTVSSLVSVTSDEALYFEVPGSPVLVLAVAAPKTSEGVWFDGLVGSALAPRPEFLRAPGG